MRFRLLTIATVFTLSLLTLGVNAQTNDGLEQRIQRREAKIKQTLTTSQEVRIKARCKAAQLKVAAAEKVATKHHENQDKRIASIISKLSLFSEKQKQNGADTTALDKALTDISHLSQSLEEAYSNYLAALQDTSLVDCQADPAGFKASLVDARQQFESLKTTRTQLHKNLKEELVPALKSFKPKKGDS